jgi:hypothetical protein
MLPTAAQRATLDVAEQASISVVQELGRNIHGIRVSLRHILQLFNRRIDTTLVKGQRPRQPD